MAVDMSDEAAKTIFQEVVDKVSAAVLAYDEAALCEIIALPTRMTTQNAETVFETPEDWLALTLRVHRGLQSLGVNHHMRLVQRASFLSENYIEGFYDTHSLRNAVPMAPSYANRATLSKVDGVWKFGMMDAEISNTRFPFTTPRLQEYDRALFQPELIEDDPRRADTSPLAIYQSYVDALTEAEVNNDFDAWCALMEFPHGLHRTDVDEWIESPEQLRRHFDWMCAEKDLAGATKVIRKASRAEFISGTSICGYHQCLAQQGDEHVLEPVAARHILRRTGTKWCAVSITNSLKNSQFPFVRDDPHNPLVSLKAIEERTGRK